MFAKGDEEHSKDEEIFEKIEDDKKEKKVEVEVEEEKIKEEKEPYDNQLASAVEVIKAIKVYKTFEKKQE